MITLYLRYTLDPNKLEAFAKYAAEEQIPIAESGGKIVGYFLPTDFAGSTSEAVGLIEFESLAEYERYRARLGEHPLHHRNVAALMNSGALLSTVRSVIQRVEAAKEGR